MKITVCILTGSSRRKDGLKTTTKQYSLLSFNILLLPPASLLLANTSNVCKRRLLNKRFEAVLDECSNSAKVTSSHFQVLYSLISPHRRRSTTVPIFQGHQLNLCLVRQVRTAGVGLSIETAHRSCPSARIAPCLLPSASCLLPSAFCLLPPAFCLLPPAFNFSHPVPSKLRT